MDIFASLKFPELLVIQKKQVCSLKMPAAVIIFIIFFIALLIVFEIVF
jgi:hypothetical protein